MDLRRAWCVGWGVFLLSGLAFADTVPEITLSSPAFEPGKSLPARYAFQGKNVSPGLRISNVPANARSLVLIVDDPDSASGLWTHWLVWNLEPTTTRIPEGKLPEGAIQGKNSFGNIRYDGPAPPSGTHRYFFHLYAIDTMIGLPSGSRRDALMNAFAHGHIVGEGKIFGTYSASP